MKQQVCIVVGSANMDLVVTTDRFPQAGETILGQAFAAIPGGKGANQAVCCAKLGGRVHFVGKMGKDRFGDQLRKSMKSDGVLLGHTMTDADASTGMALITVDRTGQNEIIVISGSNMRLMPRDIDAHRSVFVRGGVLLLQLEIPLRTVSRAVALARHKGLCVILNPAPARVLPDTLLRCVDYLTPNETEAEILTGVKVTSVRSAEHAARQLRERGVKNVVMTLGARGSLLVNGKGICLYPARRVRAVDTTAAGDAFNGALAYALTTGSNAEEAIPFANDVASLSVTRFGAQISMPTLAEVRRFRSR
ncbi:MAG TPA: ribokinase [Bacteroidota bacterium]|nr:ribokinase [Bacteroidota bacterium]